MAVLIRRVVVDNVWPAAGGETRPVDVRIVGDRIQRVEPRIEVRPGDEVVDGEGGTVFPGLHDHHVHLRAWAATASSVVVGPPDVRSAADLGERLSAAAREPRSWIRATGYHESVGGELDRTVLDRLVPDRPLRVQHRSGMLWILNSRALQVLGLDGAASDAGVPVGQLPSGVDTDAAGRPTGRLWRADRWLRDRLGPDAEEPLELRTISRRAAAAGITGFTDATPGLDDSAVAAFEQARRDGSILQRLALMSPSSLGSVPDIERPAGAHGPVKFLLDDDRLPDFDALVDAFGDAHWRGVPVAVHCVTRTQAALFVAALSASGAVPGDRMEHGAVIGPDLVPALRRLGVTIVTQPGFLFARGDTYRAEVEPTDLPDLWRLGSLLDGGVAVAISTDAPFGPENPWMVVEAAATRTTLDGHTLSPAERVSRRRALALLCGRPERPAVPRVVAPAEPADLVVIAGSLDDALEARSPSVLATLVGGRIVHRGASS